jgi:hypothetical protein
MHPFLFLYPTLAVAAIYCIWSAYLRARWKYGRTVRERVAYMLWVAADKVA